jgi:hypothetical protein
MCDYCDCRSHPAVASLSADHEQLLDVLFRLQRAMAGDDATTARALVGDVRDLLDRHAAREECGVFRQLTAADVDSDYMHSFHADHERIHARTPFDDRARRLSIETTTENQQ